MKQANLITKAGENIKVLFPSNQTKIISKNILYFIIGLFVSRGTVFGNYSPFGTALLAAIPYKNMFFGLAGTILSYLIPSEVDLGMRYISSAIAVTAIRWTLNDLSKFKENKLYAPIIAFFSIIATGLAINISNINDINETIMYITEAILSAGAAYFFCENINIFSKRRTKINQTELTYIFITIFILFLSLLHVKIWDISIGKILADFVIIFCSQYLGVSGGSIAGITAGVVFGLAYKEPSYIMGAYSFGGLLAGIGACFGKLSGCLLFFLANIIITIQTADPTIIVSEIYEILIASLIFIFLHEDIGINFTKIFSSPINNEKQIGTKSAVELRLNSIAKVMTNLSKNIDLVSEKLAKAQKNKEKNVCLACINKVCNNCGLQTLCFNSKDTETLKFFSKVDEILSQKGRIDKNDFSENFLKRCNRKDELAKNINTLHKDLLKKEAAEKRIFEVKSFVSEQFSQVGILLSDILKEIKNYYFFDLELSKKIALELKKLKLNPIYVCCQYNKFKRILIEIEISATDKNELEKLNLTKKLSKICAKNLDSPCFLRDESSFKIQFTEKPIFDLQIGIAQHVCKNGLLCGDNYTYFNNGKGQKIFILSDGMGTGGRAAVEGAMACKIMENLIKSGVSFFNATKITNSALLAKSEDEVLSTLDVVSIDLFSGEINLLKAGAPLTMIKKNNKIIRWAPESLPIGILKEINVAQTSDILTNNDKFLIVSDGAISTGEIQIENMLKNWTTQDSQNFANSVVNKILTQKDKNFDDDITVIAVNLIERI